jgi:hypothetical protein
VLHSEEINYTDYVEKCIVGREYNFKLPTDYSFKVIREHPFQLTFGDNTVTIAIIAQQFQRLPSELIFAQCVLQTMRLSVLTYGIVRINKRVTCITNEVLTSKHDCVFDLFAYELHLPQQLANCKLFAQSCSKHPRCDYYPGGTLYCTKQSRRVFKQPQCPCIFCVKIGPPSLKSLLMSYTK